MTIQPTKWVVNNNKPCPTSPHIHYHSPDYDVIEVFIHALNKYLQSLKGVNDKVAIASMNYLLEISDRKFKRIQ